MKPPRAHNPRPFRRATAWGANPVRRGVSFLEVVLGVTLLGLVSASLSMGVSAVGSSFQRQRDRLGAAEVASRLLLIRADDETFMPKTSETIPYGERQYRWTIDVGPVLVTLAEPARAAAASSTASNTIDLSKRMISVTVSVWLAETTGGTYQFDPDLPHYTLSRLIDPFDFTTSDSAERRLETQEDIERYMQGIVGSMASSGEAQINSGGGGGGARGGTSRGAGRSQPGAEPRQSRPPQPVPAERINGGGRG